MSTPAIDGLIGRYEYPRYDRPAEINHPYDPRFPEVADRVIALILARMPDVRVEHVGSTAAPGCAGKGIIDLLMIYTPGRLPVARDALGQLGFQRQKGLDPFPEERPLRVGTIEHDGKTYRLHVHVVAEHSPEVAELTAFRDRLRMDQELLDEYQARKRVVLAAGVSDNVAYNEGKASFIRSVINAERASEGM